MVAGAVVDGSQDYLLTRGEEQPGFSDVKPISTGTEEGRLADTINFDRSKDPTIFRIRIPARYDPKRGDPSFEKHLSGPRAAIYCLLL